MSPKQQQVSALSREIQLNKCKMISMHRTMYSLLISVFKFKLLKLILLLTNYQ